LNAETYAICRSDMMLKGQDASNIAFGNSFSEDGHHRPRRWTTCIAEPAVRGGVEEGRADAVKRRGGERPGLSHGRFGAGLPRINDGSFLFLQHMPSRR
jgi:type I restriction enzyme M protein